VHVNLKDGKVVEISGFVRVVDNNLINFDFSGSGVLDGRVIEPGSDLFITCWSTWALYRCKAVLVKEIFIRQFILRLSGHVTEKQSREYFRIDTYIPLIYSTVRKSSLSDCTEAWNSARARKQQLPAPVLRPTLNGFKIVKWDGKHDIEPQRVNLSANGLRIVAPEYLAERSYSEVDLFLPLTKPRVIPLIAEVLRCNELSSRFKSESYVTAMCFRHIEEKDREALITFIFAEQRRILSDIPHLEFL
jgi:hypothetical protein